MGSKVEDIRWSRRAYTLREALKRCTFPQIMKVSVGFVSSDENETLCKDQILRIHQIHTQTRVLASIKKNKWLSVPLRYADARFEVINSKKRSKPMYMRDVIDRALLPQEASFFLGDELNFDLQTAKGGVSEKLSPLVLRNMYEVCYLQGNAIYHNHLDTQVVNIPLYFPIEVNLAEGFTKHSVEQWGRYQSLLEKLVSKHVTFELFPGNQNITFFSDKRIEKAESQEDYEKISPTGTLYVTSARERLRSKTTTGSTPGVSRTVGHTPVLSAPGARARALSPGRQPISRNGDAGRARPMTKSSSASIMMSTDTVPRQSAKITRESPGGGRSLPPNSQTMPKSILQRSSPSHDIRKNNVPAQPPPVPKSARPTKGSPVQDTRRTGANGQNHMGNSRGHDNRPPPVMTTPTHHHARSPSVGSMPPENQGALRIRSPSVGALPEHVLLSPTGRIRKGPITQHSPGIINAFGTGRSPSSTSSTDSEYEHLKTLPVHIPAPDYDPHESVFQFPDGPKAKEAGFGPPPTPPPLSSIPRPKGQLPTASPQAPPPVPAVTSSASSTPSVGPAAPPLPPPPPAPVPPPPPPPPPGLDWKPPAVQAQLTPVSKVPPKPKVNNEPTMSSMMDELKKAQQQRRMSRGMDLEDAVDGGRVLNSGGTNNSPRSNIFSKPPLSSDTNELQAILNGRKASLGVNQSPVNPLPVAPRPKPVGFRAANTVSSTNNTFKKVEDIPKQLKGLTVAQVAQCLRLLNLEKHIATFQKNNIDGDFMVSLNKDMLRGDLGLSEFDIQKVMKFIQGWRPK